MQPFPASIILIDAEPRLHVDEWCSMDHGAESLVCDRSPPCDVVAPPHDFDGEADLVERAKTDPAAFGELYELHYSTILNYLYRRTLSVAAAEELTSNTFFKALRSLPTYQPRPGVRFRAWLYRIATNEVGMHWRSQGVRGRPQPLPDELSRIAFVWPAMESAEAVHEKQTRFALVHQALEGVPGIYRTTLTLRFFEGLANEEIAAILDKSVGTIKSLVHRGLAKVATALAELETAGG